MNNTNTAAARMQNLQNQIAALDAFSMPVSVERMVYATAGKFTTSEIEATLAMMKVFGLVR